MITTAICKSYKLERIDGGVHDPADVYKIALYLSSANLDADTTAYTATGEVSGEGYSAGGMVLTGRTAALSGAIAYLDFNDPVWASPTTVTARGALIYNASKSNKALAVWNFGEDVTSTHGEFRLTLPAPGATALLRDN